MKGMSYPETSPLPKRKARVYKALSRSVEREHMHRARCETGYSLTTVSTPRPEEAGMSGWRN
jgi:hypothetical protein